MALAEGAYRGEGGLWPLRSIDRRARSLASCWPEKEIDGATEVIVFPSNAELSLRSRGMAPATIRRHLAALVDAGMILRRDSANGKRFCRRDDHGEIEAAFGFDLAPFAQAAGEIFAASENARAEAQAIIVCGAKSRFIGAMLSR